MVRLPVLCLLWGCLLTTVHPEPPTECKDKQYPVNGQCCEFCPPGHKLVNDCTKFTITGCSPCGKDEFQDKWNSERHCHQHKYCDPNLGLRVQRAGTSETDTTCTCDGDQHCTSDACESCTLHRLCPPGFGVKQKGTGVSDTICEPCPVGFFSNVSSAFEKCHPWSSCETKGLVELRAGSNKTDAFCGKVAKEPDNNKGYYQKNKGQDPVEIDLGDFCGPHSTAPVQETLHGCQPVTQEDGKESRISVQEKQ